MLHIKHNERSAAPNFSITEGIITGRKRTGSLAITKKANWKASPS